VRITPDSVRLGFTAPAGVSINRREVQDKLDTGERNE
jgi:sRNA-binding carbon storage regulator CsrA